ncbi:hypothetical protein GCM10018782_08770 [Streptomyces griseoaurantiacus]|nr:hypothetical protein GCM10018782_08770 [Streptomyces griseoaurantiacus]
MVSPSLTGGRGGAVWERCRPWPLRARNVVADIPATACTERHIPHLGEKPWRKPSAPVRVRVRARSGL